MGTQRKGQTAFVIYDEATGAKLATLPLTLPIGATVEAFERAGYRIRWAWGRMKVQKAPAA